MGLFGLIRVKLSVFVLKCLRSELKSSKKSTYERSMWLIEKQLITYMKANEGSIPYHFKMSLIPDIAPDIDFSISESDIDKAVRRVRNRLVD